MNKLSAIRHRLVGSDECDCAQDLGVHGTPYFRYDSSHHLHKQSVRAVLAKRLGTIAHRLRCGGRLVSKSSPTSRGQTNDENQHLY